jgi:glutamate formiminotransferase/formiminotetrahydrofolate cyclodeaminase
MLSSGVIECVPNFSEGQDNSIIELIVDAASNIEGCKVIGAEPNSDYNRTVLTLAGTAAGVSEAAFRVISKSSELIDMRTHEGEHPRMGAVDVCPFVALDERDKELCADLAKQLSIRVGRELKLPVYLYGSAARNSARFELSSLRKGQYEALEDRFLGRSTIHGESTAMPDNEVIVWSEKVAKFGAVSIGARPVLVAYNVNLNEKDAKVAKICGSIIRSSGRLIKNQKGDKLRTGGMLKKVQGMGVKLESHGISQVSMNLQDVSITDMHIAFECVKTVAADHGVEVIGSELVGLAPLCSFRAAGEWFSQTTEVLEDSVLVAKAVEGLGLDQLSPFDENKRVIEWAATGESQ